MQTVNNEIYHPARRHTDRAGSTITAAAVFAVATIEQLQSLSIGVLLLSINAEGKTVIHITLPPPAAAQLLHSADCQHGLCVAHLGGAEIRWFQDPQPSSAHIEEAA